MADTPAPVLTDEQIDDWIATIAVYDLAGPKLLGRKRIHEFARAVLAAQAPAQQAEPLPERDTSKPAEQQGVFRKFEVLRVDGSDKQGGRHHGCEYFVLDVTHDPHARAALTAYAAAVASTHPVLARDMCARYELPGDSIPAKPKHSPLPAKGMRVQRDPGTGALVGYFPDAARAAQDKGGSNG